MSGETVIKVAPAGGTLEPYDARREAAAIARAAAIGIPVPRVLEVDRDRIAFEFVRGEILRIGSPPPVPDPYRRAFDALARRLRAAPEATGAGTVVDLQLAAAVADYERAAPRPYPAFEAGIRWLRANRPEVEGAAVFGHGDLRVTNVIWAAPGEVAAVIDWERAGPAHPLGDLAFSRVMGGWCPAAVPDGSDPVTLRWLERLELARAFTAGMRGHRAYLDGRNRNPELLRNGERGEREMEVMATWV